MYLGEIPYIGSGYTVKDQNGTVIHEFHKLDRYDDVPPDVALREVVAIKAENDTIIVEVE